MEQQMNADEARQAVYANEKVVCTKTEWDKNIRDALLDYKAQAEDLGNSVLTQHISMEIIRLEEMFGA